MGPRFGLPIVARDNTNAPAFSPCATAGNLRLTVSEGWWAHQDSNLEQAGYEPAALTVELWARTGVYQKVQGVQEVQR